MMERLRNWLKERLSAGGHSPSQDLRVSGAHHSPRQKKSTNAAPRPDPKYVDIDPRVSGEIEDGGPGKNILVRKKYIREDTGTHETLTIIDDSLVDSGEEAGDDPYNSGAFDRSKSWAKRSRK